MNIQKSLVLFLSILLLSFTIANQSNAANFDKKSHQQSEPKTINFETDPSKGRNFSGLSFNPDGTELMFNECYYYQDQDGANNQESQKRKYPDGTCKIFRLNLANNTLRHYELPDQDKYVYGDGVFSPQGNYVVMTRKPKIKFDPNLSDEEYKKQFKTKEHQELISQNYQQTEIALMKADGTNFKIIQTAQGLKGKPVMSNDETKIAYFKGQQRKPGSKTFAANFDIWEIDLKKNETNANKFRNDADNLFAGPYEFYEVGQMQYLEGDKEILMHAWGPKIGDAFKTHDYNKKYNNSSIYVIKRGDKELAEPMVVDGVRNLRRPFMMKNDLLYFDGENFKRGIGLFRKNKSGQIDQWVDSTYIGQRMQILANPKNDHLVLFIYIYFDNNPFNARTNLDKRFIGYLDTRTSEWKRLDIPLINSSKPIPVFTSKIIKTKPTEDNKFNSNILPTYKKLLPTSIKLN